MEGIYLTAYAGQHLCGEFGIHALVAPSLQMPRQSSGIAASAGTSLPGCTDAYNPGSVWCLLASDACPYGVSLPVIASVAVAEGDIVVPSVVLTLLSGTRRGTGAPVAVVLAAIPPPSAAGVVHLDSIAIVPVSTGSSDRTELESALQSPPAEQLQRQYLTGGCIVLLKAKRSDQPLAFRVALHDQGLKTDDGVTNSFPLGGVVSRETSILVMHLPQQDGSGLIGPTAGWGLDASPIPAISPSFNALAEMLGGAERLGPAFASLSGLGPKRRWLAVRGIRGVGKVMPVADPCMSTCMTTYLCLYLRQPLFSSMSIPGPAHAVLQPMPGPVHAMP